MAQLGRALELPERSDDGRPAEAASGSTPAPDRLGLVVEDRVALLDPRLDRTRSELGVLVREVAPAGLGELLGVRVGDLLVGVGGVRVTTADEIRAALAARAGAPTRVTVRRGPVRMDLALDA